MRSENDGLKRLVRKVALCLLPLCLLFGLTIGTPSPAYATPCSPDWVKHHGGAACDGDSKWYAKLVDDIKNTLEQLKWLQNIFGFISSLFDMLNSLLNGINDSVVRVGQVLSSGQEATVRAKHDAYQQLTDSKTKDSQTKAEAEAVMTKLDPHVLQQLVCNMIVARMLEIVMIPFSEMISRMVASGIPLEFRGPGMDGSGPQYDYMQDQLVRGKASDGGPPMGENIDGYPQDDQGDDAGGGNMTTGAHQNATVLARDNSYSVPSFTRSFDKGTGATLVSPVLPEDMLPSQIRWMAARNFCYTAVGRTLPRPYGKWADTAEGMRASAEYNHCAALQSYFVKQCTNRLGALSRPDCTNKDFEKVCYAARDACSAVQKAGVELPGQFDNCTLGLSLYEAQYLSRLICLSPQRSGETALAGEQLPLAERGSDTCVLILEAWKRQQALEESNWVRALTMLHKIDECWAGYARLMPRTLPKSASNENAEKAKKAAALEKGKGNNEITPVSVKLERAPEEGEAFYAEDLVVPATKASKTGR